MLKLAAFDFDGTLADSVDFCLSVFDKVFERFMGENAPTREDIYQTFGMNEPGVIRHFMQRFEPEADEYFYQLHRELHPTWCPEVYAGCRELLDMLQKQGVKLAIVTGRSETTCKISMEYLDLQKYFSVYHTGSPERNDKSAQLLKLMNDNNLQRDEIVYIGDAVSDVEACQKINIKCLAAAWAKSARVSQLEAINPGLVFQNVKDMQEYMRKMI